MSLLKILICKECGKNFKHKHLNTYYCSKCKILVRRRNQRKYSQNPEVKDAKKEYKKEWHQKTKDRKDRITKNRSASINYYHSLKKDPVKYSKFKLVHNLRKRISDVLKVKKTNNSGKGSKLFGCTSQQLRDHLENQFQPGMTWENYGEWHVDHIVPVSSFNLNDIEQRNKCYNYTNLQPLWAEDNIKKSDKY